MNKKYLIRRAKELNKSYRSNINNFPWSYSARLANSRKYKVGQVVESTDPWKEKDNVIFVTSIRWDKRGGSNGGYVVIDPDDGTVFTTTNIKAIEEVK
jgi:hypothetical protein